MNVDVIDATAEALPLELLNATNKELTAQLSRHEQLCDDKVREIEDLRRRLQFMKEHLSNVRGEVVNTQSLVECKRREVESGTHMYRLLDRECGRLKQGKAQMQAQHAEVQERLLAVQNCIFQENLRMAELKGAMTFNQDELEQWDLARKQKEADEEAVARYTKDDEVRARQLNTAVERLEAKLRDRKRALEEEVMVARNVQLELDRSAVDYRKLHHDRGLLLDEWENVVKAIHERDAAIRSAAMQYAEGAEWLEQRRAVLLALSTDLDTAREEEAMTQAGIKEREQRAEKHRGVLASLDGCVVSMEEEVETLREQLARAVRERNNSRVRAEESRASVAHKAAAYDRAVEQRAQTKKQLHGELDTAVDLEQQRVTIARLLQEARATERRLDKEVEDLKRERFTAGERLQATGQLQDELIAEISGGQSQGRNLKARIAQLDRESFAQQEVLYNVEFNVQQMQRKVSRAKGERTEEERKPLKEKIEALQSTLDELCKQQRALDTQVKRVREETRQATLEVVRMREQEKDTCDKAIQLRLACDSCAAELRKLRRAREDELVRVDTQELQLQGLKRTLHQRSGELSDLEGQKRQLSQDVSQRAAEIAVHHDLLKMEAKLAEEERRRLVAELQDRQKSLGALRNRYDVRVGRMDPEQAHWSQAQLVMEAAKEREALQHQGDALDARVARLERELLKLERALQVIRASNSNYRHMFDRVQEGDGEEQTRRALEANQRELKVVISRRALEASEYQEVLHGKTAELQQLVVRKEQALNVVEELRQACEHTHRAILEGRETVIRYNQAINKARGAITAEAAADVELQEKRQRHEAVVGRVLQLSQRHGEGAGEVARALLQERLGAI
ncbi:coiled-coil domain containing 39 [Trypanosoma rangeli]|uniref:Coiled-coil domain containing 39 n=2 Tax=Trypanosoma rangeli TaxID=5698 RepID=A0A422MZK1_TRYRA|nr:coiled-coil domain containing 39 [Trypanosoma rangeli]RNE98643.1 coiled-coil domain containing 39 [Trypanosoma rangeli]|eukprot:RNE98643.1 coiled-coil domain containing 39 [Trypanosoma rangeli]